MYLISIVSPDVPYCLFAGAYGLAAPAHIPPSAVFQ